jgi:DNA-binding IclR family transcriptional regulator
METIMRTVYKAGQVLSLFSVERPEWGVSEVSKALKFPKSSASAMMSSLAEQGLLRRTSERRYRLGWQIMAMSKVLLATTGFHEEARRAMEYLVSVFGETVHLAALERGQVIYVDKMQGTKAVQVAVTAVGNKFSAHASGVGKAILAHRPWEEVVEILEREGMRARTPNTITTLEEFEKEMERVRKEGCSYDLEEGVLELSCVAAPIRNHAGEVVAAMSLSVPTYRFDANKERYRNAIIASAREVSSNLGYAGRSPRRTKKEAASAIGKAAV